MPTTTNYTGCTDCCAGAAGDVCKNLPSSLTATVTSTVGGRWDGCEGKTYLLIDGGGGNYRADDVLRDCGADPETGYMCITFTCFFPEFCDCASPPCLGQLLNCAFATCPCGGGSELYDSGLIDSCGALSINWIVADGFGNFVEFTVTE